MAEIPMKVETKMMAFDESTATAPDRITGKKNIVAFRACALKTNTSDSYCHSSGTPGIKILNKRFLVTVKNVPGIHTFSIFHRVGNAWAAPNTER